MLNCEVFCIHLCISVSLTTWFYYSLFKDSSQKLLCTIEHHCMVLIIYELCNCCVVVYLVFTFVDWLQFYPLWDDILLISFHCHDLLLNISVQFSKNGLLSLRRQRQCAVFGSGHLQRQFISIDWAKCLLWYTSLRYVACIHVWFLYCQSLKQ